MKGKNIFHNFNQICSRIDSLPLWLLGIPLTILFFIPIAILGQGSVFPYHDQLDESLMIYVLNGRHMLEGLKVFPEMMGGINVDGMEPSALLFVPLYHFLPTFDAYLIQYAIVMLTGFFGMYALVRELTESSILSVTMAGCFCMLPTYPVYGLSQMGIPMVLYAFLHLYKKRKVGLQLLLLAYFVFTSHLAYTGYAIICVLAVAIFVLWLRKKDVRWVAVGGAELLLLYAATNRSLIANFFFGADSYVSHRTEFVNASMPFWQTAWNMFVNSVQHAPSCHKYLIVPIGLLLAAGAIRYRKLDRRAKGRYLLALGLFGALVAIALFYAFCKSPIVVNFKNNTDGILHSYQMDRFYWMYPALWFLEAGVCFSVFWSREDGRQSRLLQMAVMIVLMIPTLHEVAYESVFYMNVNQINNGSGITGYISWESYYAEDLMQELEDVIGQDMSTYRIANLGISPAPALMHGFYTVDGYSNNYPLEYKHSFRRVIAKELDKAPETAVYFDTWGSRCYLFNATTGNAWMLGKNTDIVYEDLEFDMDALKELGCDYIFSCGEIRCADELGLESMGYFETETSYWGIWLYRVL